MTRDSIDLVPIGLVATDPDLDLGHGRDPGQPAVVRFAATLTFAALDLVGSFENPSLVLAPSRRLSPDFPDSLGHHCGPPRPR
jgi:hypothetical protein